MTERVQETVAEPTHLIAQAKGRAAFLRDRGEVKSPDLLEALAARLAEVEAELQVTNGLALAEARASLDRLARAEAAEAEVARLRALIAEAEASAGKGEG